MQLAFLENVNEDYHSLKFKGTDTETALPLDAKTIEVYLLEPTL